MEHCRPEPDHEKLELVIAEVDSGPVNGDDYDALIRLVGYEQLGLIATQQLLEWRPGIGHINRAGTTDRDQIRWVWSLIEPGQELQH
jgi:hypothetical protein